MSKFEIQTSKISGRGLFATELIKAGEAVTQWNPVVLTKEEAAKLPAEERDHYTDVEGDKILWMQPPERYMNHSCSANTRVVGRSDVALRDIQPGEEITSDYIDSETENFACICGSDICRQYHHVASIVLVSKSGQLIFQKRDDKPGIRNPGMVTVWGGAFEPGEQPVEAALREITEETNLKPAAGDLEFLGRYERDYTIGGKQAICHTYLLRGVDEQLLEVYEGQGYETVNPARQQTDPNFTDFTELVIAKYLSDYCQ